MTNRKLFTAIFRYRNLSGFNNLRDSEAKQMLSPLPILLLHALIFSMPQI